MCTSVLQAQGYVKLFSVKPTFFPALAIDCDVRAFTQGLVPKRVTQKQTKQNKKKMSGHSVPLRYCILFSVPEFPV